MFLITLAVAVGAFALRPDSYVSELFAVALAIVVFRWYRASSRGSWAAYTLIWAATGSTTTLPLEGWNGFDRNLHAYYFYLGAYAVWWAIDALRGRVRLRIFTRPVNMIGLAFLAYAALSLTLASDKAAGLAKLATYAILGLFVLLVVSENRTSASQAQTLRLLQFFAVGILLLGFVRILTDLPTEPDNHFIAAHLDLAELPYLKHVPTVFFFNPNDYAVVVCLIIVGFTVKLVHDRVRSETVFSVAMLAAGLVNVVFSMSRTALISTFAVLGAYVCYVALRNHGDAVKRAGATTLAMVAGLVGLYFVPGAEPYFGKLDGTVLLDAAGAPVSVDHSASERLIVLENVVKAVFVEGHYFGLGVGNIEGYIQRQGNTDGIVDPHSFWFEVLGDFGLIGFGLYAAFLILACARLWRRDVGGRSPLDQTPLVLAIASVPLVFAPSSVLTFTPFYLILGLICARVNTRDPEQTVADPAKLVS